MNDSADFPLTTSIHFNFYQKYRATLPTHLTVIVGNMMQPCTLALSLDAGTHADFMLTSLKK